MSNANLNQGFWDEQSTERGADQESAPCTVCDAVATWSGSARIGRASWYAWTVPWPVAKLSVGPSGLVLDCALGRYDIPRQNVRGLRIYPWLPTMLEIEHDIPRYDEYLVFKRVRFGEITRTLKDLGYDIE